jgi:GMP synthase-like glutamine amidotransferase
MSVGILQCGDVPAGLEAYGPYGRMVATLLERPGEARIFDVQQGALPASADACRAWLITGSPAAVYDDLPWIAPLLGFIRAARGRAPMVGVCFGHQAIAQALGGRVEKSARGWGIGVHEYAVRQQAAWMDEGTPSVRIAASHQDQVVAAPPGARVTLASDFTPFAGLDYGDAIGFQAHPEFTPAFARALIESRAVGHGALAGPALASLNAGDDRARVVGWIRRFLAGAAAARPQAA